MVELYAYASSGKCVKGVSNQQVQRQQDGTLTQIQDTADSRLAQQRDVVCVKRD